MQTKQVNSKYDFHDHDDRPLIYFVGAIVIFLFLAAMPAQGQVAILQTEQITSARVCIDGTLPAICFNGTELSDSSRTIDSVSNANISGGGPGTPSEARSAGRSGWTELAANGSIRHSFGAALTNYTLSSGSAVFDVQATVVNAGDVYLDFVLPPGFIEIRSNAEIIQPLVLSSRVDADIVLCRPDCLSGQQEPLFNLHSLLEGGFYSHQLTNWATSADPNLDLSPLLHSTVDQTGDGFRLTKIWEYDTFRGRLYLGRFAAGEPFEISYSMWAATYANMPAYETWAAAAINDPFHLSSDPLPPLEIARFEFVPVQQPPPPPPPPPPADDSAKICLCHRKANGTFLLLKVPPPAVQAHRNHGDGFPGGDVPGRPGYGFSRNCTVLQN